MFKNYFVIGLRNLLKQKGYSLIKIGGLALGLAVSMIIYLYIREDLSYDRFHNKYRRIVRLLTIDSAEGVSSKHVGVTQPMLGPATEDELPEVLESVRFTGGGRYDLSYHDNTLKCDAAFRVDPSVFEVFDFKIIMGQKTGVLDQPGSIAITESLAQKIFGNENPICASHWKAGKAFLPLLTCCSTNLPTSMTSTESCRPSAKRTMPMNSLHR